MEEKKQFGEWLFADIHKNEYLNKLYSKLIVSYSNKLIGVESSLTNYEVKSLLRFADILSKSNESIFSDFHRNLAQNIVTMISKMSISDDKTKYVMGSVLSNVSNYVGLKSQTPDYSNTDIFEFMIEEISKYNHKLPLTCGEDNYFNSSQRIAFEKLNTSKLYSFSGPTSMGKTFLMQTFIKNKIVEKEKLNYVIIVPSKALINEIKNELTKELASILNKQNYKVITTPSVISEKLSCNYIMIYTQERFMFHFAEHATVKVDILFIDEAQKISEVGLRSGYFYKVINEAVKYNPDINIFFASPNIPNPEVYFGILPQNHLGNKKEVDVFQFSPVNQHKCIIDNLNSKIKIYNDLSKQFQEISIEFDLELISLLKRIGNQCSNIIFCDSKDDVVNHAKAFYECSQDIPITNELSSLINDIKSEIHSNCYLVPLLKRGICYHVGYLPATIKEKMEKLYREKIIRTIFCTSTLLEGVNLPADNLFIAIKKNSYIIKNIANFRNLIGRVGRKTYNLVGNVFIIPADGNRIEIISKCSEIISNPVAEQTLSIEQVLNPAMKNRILKAILNGEGTLVKKSRDTYETLDLVRFTMNILIKSVINNDTNNRIYCIFNLTEENIKQIKEAFKDKPQIADNSNTTIDQILRLEKAILQDNLAFPDEIKHSSILGFLKKLFKIFMWDKYESKLYIGNERMLNYYALLLNKWMHGENVNQIITESIKHHNDKGKIFNPHSRIEEQFIMNWIHINWIITSCLSIIENALLFSISNYFCRFSEKYKELKKVKVIDNDWSEFLDFGTNDELVIALQKLGFSREVAKIIRKNNVVTFLTEKEVQIKKTAFDILNERVLDELELVKLNFIEYFESVED